MNAALESNWTSPLDPHIEPDLERSALIVIDTQVDFADGGVSPIPGTTEVVPNIVRLLKDFRDHQLPIVHVVRLYAGDDVDLPRRSAIAAGALVVRPGTGGSQIVPALLPAGSPTLDAPLIMGGEPQLFAPHEMVIWKPRWSAFFRTELDALLRARHVDTVVFAGCNFPNCPRASIYDASERDYRVLIASDAISGVTAEHLAESEKIGAAHASVAEIGKRFSP